MVESAFMNSPSTVVSSMGADGDADARTDGYLPAVELVRPRQVPDYPLRDDDELLGDVYLFQEDREFVAAEARDGVGFFHYVLQPLRDLDQDLVPDGVAERVVHVLEPVEVEVVISTTILSYFSALTIERSSISLNSDRLGRPVRES